MGFSEFFKSKKSKRHKKEGNNSLEPITSDMKDQSLTIDGLMNELSRKEKEIETLHSLVVDLQYQNDILKKKLGNNLKTNESGALEKDNPGEELHPQKALEDDNLNNFESEVNELNEIQNQSVLDNEKPIEIEFLSESNNKRKIFYKAPFKDRRFAIENGSEFSNPDYLYKIETTEDSVEGELTLLVKNDLTRALNSPFQFLETACEYENSFNPDANGIEVISNGEVVKEDQDWLIKKKIVIKFI